MQFRQMVNEISQLVDGRVSPVTIKLYINRVIREIASLGNFDNIVASNTVALAASTEAYSLPADFSKEILLKHTNVLDYQPWGLFAQNDRTTAGVPKTYTVMGSSVLLNPPPNTSAASTSLLLIYGKEPSDLSADTDEPGLPRNYHWVIKEGALLQSLRSIPAGQDEGGKFSSMIALTKDQYETGVRQLLQSEANKGRLALTARG